MIDGCYAGHSSYENVGGSVANGCVPLVITSVPSDPPDAPRLNENTTPNFIQSGEHPQKVSVDQCGSAVGNDRVVHGKPGHRYQILA